MGLSEFAQRLLEDLESRDIDLIASYLADDYHLPSDPPLNKPDTLALFQTYFTAFPDWSFNFRDAWEKDDKIGVVWKVTGTHTGPLDLQPFGIPEVIPPTGKPISMPARFSEMTIVDGKIATERQEPVEGEEGPGLFTQLGIDPPRR